MCIQLEDKEVIKLFKKSRKRIVERFMDISMYGYLELNYP